MKLSEAMIMVMEAADEQLSKYDVDSPNYKVLFGALEQVEALHHDMMTVPPKGSPIIGQKPKEWPPQFNDLKVGQDPTSEQALHTLIQCALSTLDDMPHGCAAYLKLLAAIKVSEKLHTKLEDWGDAYVALPNKVVVVPQESDPLTVKLPYLSQAILDVVEAKSISVKQHPPEDDDPYFEGELKKAAGAYLMSKSKTNWIVPGPWPFAPEDWVPLDDRGSMIQAIVFLIAEVERMDRVEAQTDYDACAPKAVAYEQPDSAFLLGTAKTMLKPVTFICPKCHQKKSIIDFAQSPKSKDGNCMLCWPHAPGVAMAEDEEDSL